jgi:diaminopimelate epimerase
MENLPFTKMHGLGNDFIVIDSLGNLVSGSPQLISSGLAQQLCDRRFGVGADQVLWLKKPQASDCDARMEIFNADGSIAEMCGNGIRAAALYLRDHSTNKKSEYAVETLAGLIRVLLRGDEVEVDMGHPRLGTEFAQGGEAIEIEGQVFRFFEVNMGNPHAVIFVEEVGQSSGRAGLDALDAVQLERIGPRIETHPRFPKKTNVEFVQVVAPNRIRVRVWERGAGITLACGTGACASAVASLGTHRVQNPLMVELPGGELRISWSGGTVKMTGPATEVFSGVYHFSKS